MENALGLSGYTSTMLALVFIVLGLGIAALFAALFLPARWKIKYRMELVFVVLLVALVWYADSESNAIVSQYQDELAKAGFVSAEASAEIGGEDNFDRVLRVVAFQWGFAFLTDDDEISRNAAIVEPGEKVLFRIFANDVIHGFNIPVAGITAEVEPGVERGLWIRAPEKPGKYLIQCLNYCGVGHAQMKAWLVVQGPEA